MNSALGVGRLSLPSDRRRAALWLATSLLVAGALFFAAGSIADRHERHQLEAFRTQTADLARIAEAIIDGELRSLDETLLVLRDAYLARPEDFTEHLELLRSGPLADRELLVVLIDRDGYLALTDSPNAKPRMYLGDRKYFRYFADGGEDRLYIDEPSLGRVTGRYTIPVVRPLYDERRGFSGVVAISLPQQTLVKFIPILELSGGTTISIVNHGGAVVGGSGEPAPMRGTKLPPDLLAQMLQGTEGIFTSRAAPGRSERVIAYRHVHKEKTPLIVFVESLPGKVLAETSRQRAVLMVGAGLISLVVVVLTMVSLKGRETTERLVETLRSSRKQEYETLTTTSPDGFFTVDSSGRILDANDTLCALLGHPREELLRLRVTEFETVESPEQVAAHFRAVILAGSDRFQSRWRRQDGTIIDVEISAQHLKGKDGRFFVFVRDITDRKLAVERLRESGENYRSLFDNASIGIFHSLPEGRFLRVNPALARMLRYASPEEMVSTVTDIGAQLYVDSKKRSDLLADTLERAGWVYAENRYRRKDGTVLTGNLSVRKVLKPDGTLAYLEGFVDDITERSRLAADKARLEAQLRQSQKVEAIGRLAGGVAHDFNNITAIILGYGEMLLGQLPPESPLRRFTEQIVAAGQRSATLTRQLLAFSRKQTLQPQVLDLNALIMNLEQMLGRLIGEDVVLKLCLAAEPCRIKADPGQIEQVITNLALNARDAMPLGGELTVETAEVELDERFASNHEGLVPGLYVMIALTDTGCGMDEATMARLFEPFFTTKPKGKGTGLGLATVYGIVKQSGGYIWASSELDRGTSFKVYLPRTEAEAEAKAGVDGEEAQRGSGELILLVEDESSLRELCETVLARLGYRVITAANGLEALARAKEQDLRPDLVLTDVIMPGMSGAEMAERLGRERPGLRVLYMSGYPDDAITPHGVRRPGTHFIQKPFSERALAAKVRKTLAANPSGAQPGRRVLMIDDDEQFRDLVQHFCAKQGFLFAGVDSGAGALAALAGRSFDVLLVDLNIPGTDGAQVLREIRAAGHAAPAIVLTGDVASADMAALRPLGVVRALEKSSRAEPLLQAIEAAIG